MNKMIFVFFGCMFGFLLKIWLGKDMSLFGGSGGLICLVFLIWLV